MPPSGNSLELTMRNVFPLSLIMVTPARLFRYFPREASNIFAKRELWFSSPADFNDPFEALPRNEDVLQQLVEQKLHEVWALSDPHESFGTFKQKNEPKEELLMAMCQETQADVQKQVSKRFHIACFSEEGTNLLMWAHYASSHRGFVVEFDVRHDLFSSGDLYKVRYSADRPSIPKLGQLLEPFLCKSLDWEYEAEYRLIREVKTLTPGGRLGPNRKDGTYDYFAPLPIESVKSVFLGVRMPPADREEILTSLQASDACHIRHTVLRPHPTKYMLK